MSWSAPPGGDPEGGAGAPPGGAAGAAAAPGRAPLRLRLYVAASAPNSLQAIANLRALLAARDAADAVVEVVDCIREPQRALRDGVLVTPTLLKLGPPPTCTIIGALSDGEAVALALGLAHEAPLGAGREVGA